MAIKRWNANTSTWELVGTPGTVTPAAIGAASLANANTFSSNQRINGNLGIGTAATAARLALQSAGDRQIDFLGQDGNTYAYIGTTGGIGSAPANSLKIRSDAGGIIFGYQGFEQARIDTSGNVGIGMSPTYKLDVNGSIRTSGAPVFYATSNIQGNAGLVLGGPAKNVTPSGNYGTMLIQSDDPANSSLMGFMSLITDPTASNRRLAIGLIEQGSGWRNVTLTESGGNVGIGYSLPVTKLEIRSGNMINDSHGNLAVGSNNFGQDAGGVISFGGIISSDNNQSNYVPYSTIFGRKENGTSGDYASYMGFATRQHAAAITERARITSVGYFLIGYSTSNGAYRLQVNSQIFATSSSIATSDGRYKENVLPITSGLDIIDSLNPVSFNWKEHPVHNFVPGKTVGFIAQEVKEALKDYEWVDNIIKTNNTEAVLDEEGNEIAPAEEFLGIAESNIIPLLVAAVKELRAEVNTLKAQVNN